MPSVPTRQRIADAAEQAGRISQFRHQTGSMIHSLVSDEVWLEYFKDVLEWLPDETATLVLAPHPDDETLGAGALIASLAERGIDVTVAAATDGENCYEIPKEDRAKLALVRESEQRSALETLGIPPSRMTRFRLTDSGLHVETERLTDRLRSLVRPGMRLIAPWSGDFHPDHVACAAAAATVAREMNLELMSYFFWTWHRGTPDLLDDLPVVRFNPAANAIEAKQLALEAHRSQLEHPTFEPILPERLLGPARWPFEVFLRS